MFDVEIALIQKILNIKGINFFLISASLVDLNHKILDFKELLINLDLMRSL
jgi:hypothetical protein